MRGTVDGPDGMPRMRTLPPPAGAQLPENVTVVPIAGLVERRIGKVMPQPSPSVSTVAGFAPSTCRS